MITHDLLIISSGLAGMRAAPKAGKNVDAAAISKVHPLRSHSGAAQGGTATGPDGWTELCSDSPAMAAKKSPGWSSARSCCLRQGALQCGRRLRGLAAAAGGGDGC